jgi:hypothetical protein
MSVADKILDLERRYPGLMGQARRDVEELLATGRIEPAAELARATGQHLNATVFPMYFTGDPDADVVLVHLNPKQDESTVKRARPPFAFASFEEYSDKHRHFGAWHYGPRATERHYEGFDAKQIRFLRPFSVLPFVEEDGRASRRLNLELVVDGKLQMELVPYGSRDFRTGRFPPQLVQEHFNRVFGVISARSRRYVFFCGSAFDPLIGRYAVDDHRFYLPPKGGGRDRNSSRFANLVIPFEGRVVKAGLCRTWPRQGIPMDAYGKEIAALYRG